MNPRMFALARRFLLADTSPLSTAERWRSFVGALIGTALSAFLMHAMPVGTHWIIPPVGASVVILYALPHSPLAQPWPVVGSYAAATLSALVCADLIPIAPLAAAMAVACSIWIMARLNCIHPPGGALAILLVLGGADTMAHPGAAALLVLLNVAAMLLAALVVNNLIPGRRYPYSLSTAQPGLHATKDASPLKRLELDHADLQGAVQALDTFVDVQEEELVQLYRLAVEHAFDRHIGMTCGDIMSRDVVSVEFGTDLDEAWRELRAHKIKALPVVDRFRRLIGVLTVADYLRQMDDTTAAGLAVRLQGLLQRTPGTSSDKAEVVGQIMTEKDKVYSARVDTPISELIQRVSEQGLHHIPVLDDTGRVLGMVTHSDLMAALYKRLALCSA